jgi:hypothetical protein
MHSDAPTVVEAYNEKALVSGAFSGASRTRTGDLLGAIQPLFALETAWLSHI